MLALKTAAYEANMFLVEHNLTFLTWGNASAFDAGRGIMAIKPSGVPYRKLSPENMVVLDSDGTVVAGRLRPSSDAPTHLRLYQAFPGIGGITHTHSRWGTIWSQMQHPIPPLGTTHADYFAGDIPCTHLLSQAETESAYEKATGDAIVKAIGERNPLHVPAVLVAGHGPFTWGKTALDAAEHALILEEVANMAWHTLALEQDCALPGHISARHFSRKHGPGAYYGQR